MHSSDFRSLKASLLGKNSPLERRNFFEDSLNQHNKDGYYDHIFSILSFILILSYIYDINYLHIAESIFIFIDKPLSYILSILGAIGGIILLIDKLQSLLFNRLYLNLNKDKDTTFILTSRANGSGKGETKYETGVAQVRASSLILHYFKSHISDVNVQINFSTFSDLILDGNLVIIGGPAKNRISELAIKELSKATLRDIQFSDAGDSLFIRLDDKYFRYSKENKTEYALVAIWENTLSTPSTHDSRLILCCGLTGSGTETAARWLVKQALCLDFDKRTIPEIGRLEGKSKLFWILFHRDKFNFF